MFAQRLKQLRKGMGLGALESRAGWKGLCRKGMTLLIIIIAHRLDLMLAQEFRVSNGAVGMWETGKREPDFATIHRLAEFFHVSADYLKG